VSNSTQNNNLKDCGFQRKQISMKDCNKCRVQKDDNDFRPKRRICKDCEREHGREYRKNNPDKSKEWADKNKERMKELQSNWYKSNKNQINTKFRERYHNVSSEFKKVKNYRTALSHMVSGEQKTNKYVGCDSRRLKDWCEYCLEDNMTMDTYPITWVIDHVIPLHFSEQYGFEFLAKWYNIMPVQNKYNLVKNKYIVPEQLFKHIEKVKSYFENRNLSLDTEYMELLARLLDAGTPLEP
jgi:hypothetical protein